MNPCSKTSQDSSESYLEYLKRLYQYQVDKPEPFTSDILEPSLNEGQKRQVTVLSWKIESYLSESNTSGITLNMAKAVSELALRLRFRRVCVVTSEEANGLRQDIRLLSPLELPVVFARVSQYIFACIIRNDLANDDVDRTLEQRKALILRYSENSVLCGPGLAFIPSKIFNERRLEDMIRRRLAMSVMADTGFSPYNICLFEYAQSYLFIQQRTQMSLYDFMNQIHTLALWNQRSICLNLVESLLTLHRRGIIHRDIKSDNYIVHQSRHTGVTVLLTDYEACCFEYDRGAFSFVRGTYVYLPPELFQRVISKDEEGCPATKAADVWSLGLILYSIYYKKELPLSFRQCKVCKLWNKQEEAVEAKQALQHKLVTDQVIPGFETIEIPHHDNKVEKVELATLDRTSCETYIKELDLYVDSLTQKTFTLYDEWRETLKLMPKRPRESRGQLRTVGDIACAMLQVEPDERLSLQEAFSIIQNSSAEALFSHTAQPEPTSESGTPSLSPVPSATAPSNISKYCHII